MSSSSIPTELSDFLESLPIAISLAAIENDHPLVFINQRFSELTGYAPVDMLGRNCRFLQRGERDKLAALQLRTFLTNEDIISARAPLINFRQDGTPFVNLLYLTRLRGASGETRYILGSQFDVSRIEANRLHEYDQTLGNTLAQLQPKTSEIVFPIDDALAVLGDSVGLMTQAHFKLITS